ANVSALQQMIRDNWMIVPATASRDDEADVPGRWRSRDIPPQESVLVRLPDDTPEDEPYRFPTYEDARGFFLEHAVECPHYLIERALKQGTAGRFSYVVGEDRRADAETVYFYTDYDPPDSEGCGSGLARLAVRYAEDQQRPTDEDDW